MAAEKVVFREGENIQNCFNKSGILIIYSKTSFDIITEEDEDIEEYEYPELVKNDDEDDRDQWLEEVETVTNRIVSISNRVKDEYNLKLESFNHHQSNNCQKVS